MRLHKVVTLITLSLAPALCASADAPFEQRALDQMLTAIQAESLSDFISFGDALFQAMPADAFKKTTTKFSPLLKAGYRSTYLGEFKETAVRVHYWKLEFKGEPNGDWLAKLAVGDGKVKGFFITRP